MYKAFAKLLLCSSDGLRNRIVMHFYLTAFPITECGNANRWDFLLSIKFVFVRLDRLYPTVRLDVDVNACIRDCLRERLF